MQITQVHQDPLYVNRVFFSYKGLPCSTLGMYSIRTLLGSPWSIWANTFGTGDCGPSWTMVYATSKRAMKLWSEKEHMRDIASVFEDDGWSRLIHNRSQKYETVRKQFDVCLSRLGEIMHCIRVGNFAKKISSDLREIAQANCCEL